MEEGSRPRKPPSNTVVVWRQERGPLRAGLFTSAARRLLRYRFRIDTAKTTPVTEILIVLTHCPDAQSAERISRALIEARHAACVNLPAPAVSIYRWRGKIEEAREHPLVIKCTRERFADVQSTIRALHPYELPEIVAVPVAAGYAPYLRWIADETQRPLIA
jgi:periplasmic divalent cation tolerance protein